MADELNVLVEVTKVILGAVCGAGGVVTAQRVRARRNGHAGHGGERPQYELLAVEPGWKASVDRELGKLTAGLEALEGHVSEGFQSIRDDLRELRNVIATKEGS
jgi:hypothetical protein